MRKPSRHEAVRAKTARARASIARRYLMTSIGDNERGFYDCFGMFDGDEVVRIVIEQAQTDFKLADAIRSKGYGFWLEPGYLQTTA